MLVFGPNFCVEAELNEILLNKPLVINDNHSTKKAYIYADDGYSQINIWNVVFARRQGSLDTEDIVRTVFANRVQNNLADATANVARAVIAPDAASTTGSSVNGSPRPKAKAKAKGKGKAKAGGVVRRPAPKRGAAR